MPDDRDEDHYVPPCIGERYRDMFIDHFHKSQHNDEALAWPRQGERS